VDKEDEVGGIKIAKNTTIMANAWAVGRDEAVFDPALGDLQDFNPEGWLREGMTAADQATLRHDVPVAVFGQGVRICQGKRVAVDGLFMQATNLLWAFAMELTEEVDPWSMVVVGFMTVPKEFRFKLKPKGSWVLDVI